MSLREDITAAQLAARKEHNADKLSTLQMAISAMKNEEIDKQKELTDEDIIAVLQRQVKQLKDANKDFAAAGRDDLQEKNNAEIAVLETFLPAQMSEEEIALEIDTTIAEIQPNGPADFGKVMGAAMSKLKGRADGALVQKILKEKLS